MMRHDPLSRFPVAVCTRTPVKGGMEPPSAKVATQPMESLLHALLGGHADGTAAPLPGTGESSSPGSVGPLLSPGPGARPTGFRNRPRHRPRGDSWRTTRLILDGRTGPANRPGLPSEVSCDELDAHIRKVRRITRQSWSNLLKATLSLQGKPREPFGTPNVQANRRERISTHRARDGTGSGRT